MISYRYVKEDELENVSKLYASSFKEYCFFNSTIGETFMNKRDYLKCLETLFFVTIKAYMKKNICLVGVLDGKIISSAMLKDPSTPKIGLWDYICAGGMKLFKECNPLDILRFLGFWNDAQEGCKDLKTHAWYLEGLVVDKSCQGQNLGSKMINECLKPYIASHGGNEFILITNSEINRKFYTRNGFKEFHYKAISFKNNIIDNWSYRMTV